MTVRVVRMSKIEPVSWSNWLFLQNIMVFQTIVITQQLTSIAKLYRENISKAVIFHTPNKNTTKTIFDEFLDVSREEETSLQNKLKNTKYTKLEINLRYPYDYKIVTPQKSGRI